MLENILIDYFGLAEFSTQADEERKEEWYNAYGKLIKLIYELCNLGVIDEITTNNIVRKLDEIDNIKE